MLDPGFAYALSLLGLVSITASLSVMLWALQPLIVFLAGWLLHERVDSAAGKHGNGLRGAAHRRWRRLLCDLHRGCPSVAHHGRLDRPGDRRPASSRTCHRLRGDPFLSGRSMVNTGSSRQHAVVYPIWNPKSGSGKALINWGRHSQGLNIRGSAA